MSLFIGIALIVLSAACFGAWLRNIARIASDARNGRGGMIVARALGVFVPPLGMLLGFIGEPVPATRKEVRPWKH